MTSFTPWTQDDAGDLINLAHIQLISIATLHPEAQADDIHAGHTHELVAILPDQTSFRLALGSLEHCQANRDRLARMLLRSEVDPHLMKQDPYRNAERYGASER